MQAEFERQQKRDQERRDHAARMTELDEQIRKFREAATDNREFQEMQNALEQKRQDLEDARLRVVRLPELNLKPTKPLNSSTSTLPLRPQAVSLDKGTSEAGSSIASDVRNVVTKALPVQTISSSEIEWERQKRLDNCSNNAIDSLMVMTGLEEVKAQFLTIKARIDTALRQNIDLKNERFGIVLLGNPGTGRNAYIRVEVRLLILCL